MAVDADIRQVPIVETLELPERDIAVAPAAQARGKPAEALAEGQKGARMA